MSELEKVKKQRTIGRGNLTKARNVLEKLVESEGSDSIDLEEALLTEDELDASQEEAWALMEKTKAVRKRATRALRKISEVKADVVSEHNLSVTSNQSALHNVRLPKLELPTFSGSVMEWQSFWDQFKATVHESSIPEVNKFTYLRSLVKGEAKSCIEGLSMTKAHYHLACGMLEERFGKPERIIFAHIQGLLCMTMTVQDRSLASFARRITPTHSQFGGARSQWEQLWHFPNSSGIKQTPVRDTYGVG